MAGGTVLVDASGLTLYSLSAERDGKFICTTSSCQALWRPLLSAVGTPSGVESLSTVKRPDGRDQVTYKAHAAVHVRQRHQARRCQGPGLQERGHVARRARERVVQERAGRDANDRTLIRWRRWPATS